MVARGFLQELLGSPAGTLVKSKVNGIRRAWRLLLTQLELRESKKRMAPRHSKRKHSNRDTRRIDRKANRTSRRSIGSTWIAGFRSTNGPNYPVNVCRKIFWGLTSRATMVKKNWIGGSHWLKLFFLLLPRFSPNIQGAVTPTKLIARASPSVCEVLWFPPWRP